MKKKELEVELPSNRKFGFFFSFIFIILAIGTNFYGPLHLFYLCVVISIIFFILSVFKSDFLRPLNFLWMKLGLLLSYIISPIILGIIFFGLITPIAIFIKLKGRDELSLKNENKKSHWNKREDFILPDSFKNQF
tara:strand:+ start:755 stop:1159 length:405 start_codon:yes stop_codon:yes gene_type:complete